MKARCEPTKRERAVGEALLRIEASYSSQERRRRDPVDVVHDFSDPLDQELVALVAACMAFGNAKTIVTKVREVTARLNDRPSKVADSPKLVFARLAGFRHRVFLGEDVARVLLGARSLQREHGSLGAAFAKMLTQADGELRVALSALVREVRSRGEFPDRSARRGPAHILPNPAKGSAVKRLVLFLRWMIRPSDGVDLGLWPVDPRVLVVPVDVHLHRIGKNLGFTRERTASWKAAEEITRALAVFAPEDPVRFDFPLCHMGMAEDCPSRRDEKRCGPCAIKPVCIHWPLSRSARSA